MNREKFYIYDPLLSYICRMEDKDTGKILKKIFEYILYEKPFINKRKDMAEMVLYANSSLIERMKTEKNPKKNAIYITFLSVYADMFNLLNDEKTGRLFKKIVNEELKTDYKYTNKSTNIDTETEENYKLLQEVLKEYRNEKNKEKTKTKHDFSRIKNDFPNIGWYNANLKAAPYKSVDCVKLYDFIKKSNIESSNLHISVVIEMYEMETKNSSKDT